MTWPLVPLKRCVAQGRPITYGIVQAGEHVPDGVPYIRPVDMTEASGVKDVAQLQRTSQEIALAYRRAAVRTGDLIVSIGPSFGKVMVVPPGLAGANLTQGTARVSVDGAHEARFFYWALQSGVSKAHWEAAVGGATFRALNLGPLTTTPIPVPPRDEQRRIAAYLDAETGRIDRLIQLRGRTTLLAVERAQALLDRMFQNPEWRPVRLKHLLRRGIRYGVLVPRFVPSGGVRFIRVNDLAHLEQRADDLVQIEAALSAEYSRTVVQEGDLLIAVVGSVGNATLVPASAAGSNLARAVARVPLRHGVDAGVLRAWTMTRDYDRQVKLATGSDTAQPTLNVGDLSNFSLRVPPSGAGWRAARIESELLIQERDRWVHLAAKHLRLLTERRNALVTAGVTGQLDVTIARGVA